MQLINRVEQLNNLRLTTEMTPKVKLNFWLRGLFGAILLIATIGLVTCQTLVTSCSSDSPTAIQGSTETSFIR